MADSPAGSLSRSPLVGTSWLLAQNVGTRAISFASQIVLAKLLVPGDFGAIGLALTVTTLASVVANFGVDDVLLQRQKSLRFWASAAFSYGRVAGRRAPVAKRMRSAVAASQA